MLERVNPLVRFPPRSSIMESTYVSNTKSFGRYQFMLYTQHNKLRVTQWTSPYMVCWVSSVMQTRHDIEKRFSASFK